MELRATMCAAEDLELVDGEVKVKGAPFRAVSVREVAAMAQRAGGPGPIHSPQVTTTAATPSTGVWSAWRWLIAICCARPSRNC